MVFYWLHVDVLFPYRAAELCSLLDMVKSSIWLHSKLHELSFRLFINVESICFEADAMKFPCEKAPN